MTWSPAIMTAYGPFITLLMMGYRLKALKRWVATYAFHNMIERKAGCFGEKRWMFKDVDLTDEEKILSRVLSSLFYLFLVLFGGVVLLFYWLLLLETSFQCDPNNKALDCFKYTLWHWETIKNFSREAVDCNSTAARNGTVEVLCYKIVFNFGLAAGASYGSYHITMAFFNVATAALLMVKEVKTICKIRVSLIVPSLGFITAYIMVAITSLRYYIVSDNLVIVLQGIVSMMTGFLFMFAIPWKKLITLKQADHQSATRLRAVFPFTPASDEKESPEKEEEEEGDHEELGIHKEGSRQRQRSEEGQEGRELEAVHEEQRSPRNLQSHKDHRHREKQKRHLEGLQNPAVNPV